MDVTEASETCETIVDAVSAAVIAERSFLETVLLGVIARGHVLLEDAPGTGKTLTARSVATALGLSFSRIQFTPDLLPSDITGTHVYDERTGDFEFNRGPVFANVVIGAGESDVDEDVSPPPLPRRGRPVRISEPIPPKTAPATRARLRRALPPVQSPTERD